MTARLTTAPDVTRALAHLRAAFIQVAPSDDPIIVQHMRDAYRLLGGRDL